MGQDECHRFLENDVKNLLSNEHVEDEESTTDLLNEIQSTITDEDNEILLKTPDMNEIKNVIKDSNLHSAPGFDGVPVALYDACWNSLSVPFLNMVKAIHDGGYPTPSQNISVLVYGSKAGKEKSLNPSDKRRISLLNSDFKIMTGIEARRLKAVSAHLLDTDQLVASMDSRLHHGINKVRDAITVLGKRGMGGAIADFDFTAAFDNLCINFCFKVMKKKGISQIVLDRLKRIYKNGATRVCVNDRVGDPILNIYQSLRQGDITSMLMFVISMEPLLKSLKRMLKGIVINKVKVQGPLSKGMKKPLFLEEVFKLIGYADDLKIAIRTLEDLIIAVRQCTKMEMASGVRLHRSVTKGKCRLLPVGSWRESLTQSDIPFDFVKISDTLNLLGVSLCATYRLTRKRNAEIIVDKVEKISNLWRAGRFMPLIDRAHAVNSNLLSKIWFRCGSIPLRGNDIKLINKSIKNFIFQDYFNRKISHLIIFRPIEEGGLGLFHTKSRSESYLIKTFLETAVHKSFKWSVWNNLLYRQNVLGECFDRRVEAGPYYTKDFFIQLNNLKQKSGVSDISTLSIKEIYRIRLNENVLHDCFDLQISLPIELSNTWLDFGTIWSRLRSKGVDGLHSSIHFLFVHNWLPTKERTMLCRNERNPEKSLCKCGLVMESAYHVVTDCLNKGSALLLQKWVHKLNPKATLYDIVYLNVKFSNSVQESAYSILTSNAVYFLWENRMRGLSTNMLIAHTKVLIRNLHKTKFSLQANIIEKLLK